MVRLFIVPWPCAGTVDRAAQGREDGVDDAAGGLHVASGHGGGRQGVDQRARAARPPRPARRRPAEAGMSGSVTQRTTK